jgi:hypothetical protein
MIRAIPSGRSLRSWVITPQPSRRGRCPRCGRRASWRLP